MAVAILVEHYIYEQEREWINAPGTINPVGLNIGGPTIMQRVATTRNQRPVRNIPDTRFRRPTGSAAVALLQMFERVTVDALLQIERDGTFHAGPRLLSAVHCGWIAWRASSCLIATSPPIA